MGESSATARFASKARPLGPIFALTPRRQVADQLSLVWGVTPVLVDQVDNVDELIALGERALLEANHVHRGEEIVILAGKSPRRETTNLMKIHQAGTE